MLASQEHRGGWLHYLEPFSLAHATTALGFGALMLFTIVAGVQALHAGREPAYRRGLAAFIGLWQAASIVWWLLPRNLDWSRSLPLQLCDLAGPIAAIALFTQRRWARVLLFYWGLGLCSQAFVTPVNHSGPASLHYWFFWVNHAQIVGAALYDIIVLRYRPTLRDGIFAFGSTLVYAAVVLPLDLAFGWNYGYLGRELAQPGTLIEWLGPWPWRLAALGGIVALLFALMTVAFPLGARLRTLVNARSRGRSTAPGPR